jgi:glycosyltransferase involved in cell wall biosynthesis
MTTQRALVSIVIPAYNAEKFIAETIDSVIGQTYTNWELIVVDDGSKDGTKEVVAAYLGDPRVKYVHQQNAGVSLTRNHGIRLSKGEYITFLDADDHWQKNNLEEKIKFLEQNPVVDWVFSDRLLADEDLNYIGHGEPGRDVDMLKNILLWEGEVVPGLCSNMVMRRKCAEAGLAFDPALSTAADQDFSLQLASRFTGKRIPQALWTYRIRKTSMSRNIELMERDHIRVYRKAEQQGLFPSFWFRQRCFSNLYLTLAGSWWVDAGNKARGLYFIMKSLLTYPPNIGKLTRKLLK